MSKQVEFANRNPVEARDLARYMISNGAPRRVALRAQAAAELREELGSKVDADLFNRALEHRFQILLSGGK